MYFSFFFLNILLGVFDLEYRYRILEIDSHASPTPVGSYGDDAGSVVISSATFWWILFPLLFPGCGDSVCVGGATG